MADLFHRHIALRVGAAELARVGQVMGRGFDYGLQGIVPFSFARADASTCATFLDRNGILRVAPAGKLRLCWLDLNADGVFETPVILLEDTGQNLFQRSEEHDNAAWSKNTSVTVSANADVAPDGLTTADRIVEAALTQEQVIWQTLTATANVKHAVSTHGKAGTRTWIYLTIRDVNAATNAVLAWFNLATGAIGTVSHNGVGSGEQAFIERRANGFYRCILVGACNNSDTTPLGTVGLANANGNISYAGDGASYATVWGSQFENDHAVASSYIKTVGSAVTRAADNLQLLTSLFPEVCTLYLRFVELGTQRTGGADGNRLFKVPGTGSPALWIQASNNNSYTLQHHNGVVQMASPTPSAVSMYDVVELVGQVDPSGKPQIFQSKNGAAWEVGSQGSAAAFAAAWGGTTLDFNQQGASLRGHMGLMNLLWARSVLVDPSDMRKAAA